MFTVVTFLILAATAFAACELTRGRLQRLVATPVRPAATRRNARRQLADSGL